MTESAYDRVTAALSRVTGFVPNGGRNWQCPHHEDGKASLTVTQAGDKVLLHCQAGCSTDDVLAELSLKRADLFDKATQRNGDDGEWTPYGPATAVYRYVDEDGRLLFEVCRTADKAFPARRPDRSKRNGWAWKLEDTRRVLYRLPQVIAAVREGKTIYVVEGEKDVASLESQGKVATCNPGGAGKWRDEYSTTLTGAEVVIVADADDTGRRHARQVEASLKAVRARPTALEPTKGKDVTDHLAAGGTLEELVPIGTTTEEAPDPDTPGADIPVPRAFKRLRLNLSEPPPPTPVLVRPLYADLLTVLQSEPGVGKSWMAAWWTWQVMQLGYSVIYLDEEGGPELVTERLVLLGADPAVVDELLFYYAFEARTWGLLDIAALDDIIKEAHEAGHGLALGVFDSLPDFLAIANKSEDSAQDVTAFVATVLSRFRDAGAAQLLLDHLPKPQSEGKRTRSRYSRGSGAKLAKADATLLLETHTEFDAWNSGRLRLWKTKDRRGRLDVPHLSKPPLEFDVTVEPGVSVRFDERAQQQEIPGAAWDGPTECMAAIEHFLKAHPGEEFSKRDLAERLRAQGLSYRDETIREAAERLANNGRCQARTGPRRSRLFVFTEGGSGDLGDF